MRKILLILVILTPTLVWAQDTQALLKVAREAKATDSQIAEAIDNNMSPEEFLKFLSNKVHIVAPNETDQPVVLRVEGEPEKCTRIWRTPEGDTFLQLFDSDGKSTNIFWSKVAGLKHFELIVAENGKEVPVVEIATHDLQYNLGPGPGPSPGPGPGPTPDTPSEDLQQAVLELRNYAAKNIDAKDNAELCAFYHDFSDVIRRDAETKVISTTAEFRSIHVKAGKLMFQQTGMDGKYAGLPEIIDGILAKILTLDVMPINHKVTADVLNAISWAFYMGGKVNE